MQAIEEDVHAKITEQMITKHFNLDSEDPSKAAARKNIKPFNIDDVRHSNNSLLSSVINFRINVSLKYSDVFVIVFIAFF